MHRPSLQGSVFWMAPEVVKQSIYTKKADIWSVGCLVVEMLTGDHPWAQLSQMQAIYQAWILSSSNCNATYIFDRLGPLQDRRYPLIYQPMLKAFSGSHLRRIMRLGHLLRNSRNIHGLRRSLIENNILRLQFDILGTCICIFFTLLSLNLAHRYHYDYVPMYNSTRVSKIMTYFKLVTLCPTLTF